MKSNFLNLIFCICIVINFGCYEAAEGCLDIEATNYNVLADKQCEDCCNYPNLKLSINHQITGQTITMTDTCVNHSVDSLLSNVSNEFFKIENMFFFLSDFRLTLSTGEIARINDTIRLNILDDAITLLEKDTLVIDDFVLIKRTVLNTTLGEFRAPGTFEKVQFKVGFDARLNSTDPTLLEDTHALGLNRDSMFTDDRLIGYNLQRFGIFRDSMSTTESYDYDINDPFSNLIDISLDYSFTVRPGFDVTIPLKINYSEWLKGIDFATEMDSEIKEKIVNNTANAFEINQ